DPDQAVACAGARGWAHGETHPHFAARARAGDRDRGRAGRRGPGPRSRGFHATAGRPQDHPAVRTRHRAGRGPVPRQLLLRGQAGAAGGGRDRTRGRGPRRRLIRARRGLCLPRQPDGETGMDRLRQCSTTIAAVAALLLAACNPAGSEAPRDDATHPASSADAAPATRYDAKAVFTTTSYGLAGGHAWSAGDDRLLVSSDQTGIYNAYAIAAGDGTAEPLTASTTDSTYAISWFPGDDRVLFTADQGGNELDHLYVREQDGSTRDLTPGEKVKAGFLRWSADGTSFYVMTNERDPAAFDLYRYATDGYERTLVFRSDD